MPGMDGFEALSRIRVHKKTKDLPVIFLTGFMRDPQYMDRGFSLGVNEYLLKPIETSELLVRVRSVLRMTAAEKKVKQLQSDFFHDLRGPLTAVHASAQLLIEEKELKEEDRSEVAHMIEGASVQMLNLINDILDLSKLEYQFVTLNRQPMDLKRVIDRSMLRMKILASKKSLNLQMEYEAGATSVTADQSKIEQVMDNLLMNGIKFTNERGHVGVSLRSSQEDDPVVAKAGVKIPCVIVCVKDTGVGIPEKDIPYIFDKYRQLVTSSIAAGKGTGLGLAICRNIIEAHGGKIWVESEEHVGSSFYFSLPLT